MNDGTEGKLIQVKREFPGEVLKWLQPAKVEKASPGMVFHPLGRFGWAIARTTWHFVPEECSDTYVEIPA